MVRVYGENSLVSLSFRPAAIQPFFLGWRYVARGLPRGRYTIAMIPPCQIESFLYMEIPHKIGKGGGS